MNKFIFFLRLRKLKKIYSKVEYKINIFIESNTFCNTNILPIRAEGLFFNEFLFKKHHITCHFFLAKILKLLKTCEKKKIITNIDQKYFLYLNKFVLTFLENLFKISIILNIKKGSNWIFLKEVSNWDFYKKFFKKFLNVQRQILGVLYYSLLLKDSYIFVSFFKKIFEKSNIKLHKKLIYGLKKVLNLLFKPLFKFLGVLGVFFNIKGKIGVSGNAKKRRYYFSIGEHSFSKRTLKMDYSFSTVNTFTGVLGFSFIIFF